MPADAPRPLPRGRHTLSRSEVSAAQRDRILDGLAEAMADKGYVGTSVTDIIKRAGVSRETFYELFESKHDCFHAAFAMAGDMLLARLSSLAEAHGSREERLDALFDAYFESLVEFPAFARLFLVEAYAAGPEIMALRADRQRLIAAALADLLDLHDADGRFACELVVAGVGALVTTPLVRGDQAALAAVRAPLTAFALRQLGPVAATETT
ncbi:MAG: TetR/AcrR family transcriptional regulator [Aquihabitans sp.]